MANPSPQHTPTDGLGTPTKIVLTGSGVTVLAGSVYQVTLSLGGTATVALTATLKDVGGNTVTSGNSNTVAYNSLNAGTGAGDVARICTVSGSTITAVHVGQGIVEAKFPTFDTTDGTDVVYAQIVVTVTT